MIRIIVLFLLLALAVVNAFKSHNMVIKYKSSNKQFMISSDDNNNDIISNENNNNKNNNKNNNNQPMRYGLIGLSSLGAIETGYLTVAKLSSIPLLSNFCSSTSSSCNDVLSSPYSVIPGINIPLSLLAFIGYMSITIMASYPILNKSENEIENKFNSAILFTSTAMAAFSLYLMMILTFVLQDSCNFCYLSAFLSTSMALLSWNSRIEPNPTKAAVVTSSSVALTAISSAFLFYTTSIFTMPDAANALNSRGPDSQDMKQAVEALKKIKAQEEEIKAAPKRPPDITKHSNDAALKVAAKLKNMNAKMYGAYWCSHCYNQKQTLGIEAYESFEYIECDKEGENSQNALCKSKKVPGYPTWEIAGELYPGEKDIDELEKLLTSIEKNKDLFKD